MSWHLICKSGRGAAFAFYDTLSRSLIYPSSLLLDVFLFPFSFFFFFVYTHTSGGDICGSGWGWNESRGKKREEGRKRGAECFWTPARVYAFFFIFFFLYLPAVYLARALSQQEETKNSSDGKSVVVDLHNSVVQKKKKKRKGLLLSVLQDDRLDYLFIDDRMLIWELLRGSELSLNLMFSIGSWWMCVISNRFMIPLDKMTYIGQDFF